MPNESSDCQKLVPFDTISKSPCPPLQRGNLLRRHSLFTRDLSVYASPIDIAFPLCKGGQGDFNRWLSKSHSEYIFDSSYKS